MGAGGKRAVGAGCCGHPALWTCPLEGVAGRALWSCRRPRFAAPLQSARTARSLVRISVPCAQPGALGAAAAFYSPPAFVWVPAPTMGRGGVRSRLWSRAAPQPVAPPASVPPDLALVVGEGPRSAEHCCLRSPPLGATVAAAPPAGAARWYNQAPIAGGWGLRAAQRPLGVSPLLCEWPTPGPLPCPRVS